MVYRFLADALVVFHTAFVLSVAFGGLVVLRYPRAIWVHVPVALWGATIELTGWICPLTTLENHLRRLGGEAGYTGGFIAHHLTPILYPAGLTRTGQFALAAFVLALNAAVYTAVWRRRRKER
ncbi:MAG TPA: DUF2784 domain-containing protein [Thermoanaerobaculia bacterium]|nr:DUF2784 domain-containing protein [Thermoanaerobaculia bacterium]